MNRDLLIEDIHRLMDGELVELPVYDFKAGGVGGYKPMQGDKDAVIIAEGIHMLNPLIFDQLRSEATGVYVAPRTRIITHKDRIVRPEQLRVARRMIRDYQAAAIRCVRPSSAPRVSTAASSTTSCRTSRTRASTSTRSTTTSRASSRGI